MIRLRQTGRTNDRPRNGRPRVTSQRQARHLRLIHLRKRMITAVDTARRTPGLANIKMLGQTVCRRLRESGLRARHPVVGRILRQRHGTTRLTCARARRRWRLCPYESKLYDFCWVFFSLCKKILSIKPLHRFFCGLVYFKIYQRSEYDKGRFWPNLRNCLYRYNIKHNHWKVIFFFFYDFTLSFVVKQRKWRRVQLIIIIGNSNMVVLFYISCIVFSTKCYILCMYTLKIIFQFSMVAYSIFV